MFHVFARDHVLTGLEFACGIPGSVGGVCLHESLAHMVVKSKIVSTTRFVLMKKVI